MAKGNKSQRSQLAKTARAEERANVQKVMTSLNLTMEHYKTGGIYDLILHQLRTGLSIEQVHNSVKDSHILEEARQDEARRQLKIAELEQQRHWTNEANTAFKSLNITQKQHRGKEIWKMANNLARQDFTSVQILEKLQAHPLVEESRHRTREIDQEYKQKHAERWRNRVKISDVLKYMAEKNGTTYIPPDVSKKKSPHKVVAVNHPLRYTDTGTTRPLSGKSSTSTENPRTYDLPTMPVNAKGMNTARLADAKELLGIRYADFLKYHIHHKDNGLDALEQALIYIKRFPLHPQ